MSGSRNNKQPSEDGGPAENGVVCFPDAQSFHVVNLSHAISPSAPRWPGDPPVELQEWSAIKCDGFFLRRFSMSEHGSTHLTAPASFYEGGTTVDDIPTEKLVAPAVVIDVRAKCLSNPDYALTTADLLDWESRYGRIPPGCTVLLLTGWSEYWDNPAVYLGEGSDGGLHFPGFGLQAAKLLVEDREVGGLGTDTAGVDPGAYASFLVSRAVLGQPRIVLENLANLYQLPASGSTLVIGHLRLVGGSGSPVAVTAFLPSGKK